MELEKISQINPTLFMVSVIASACCCVVILIILILYKLRLDKSNNELNKITNNIRAGLVQFIAGDVCNIRYASKGFYDLLGYSKKEDKLENTGGLINFIFKRQRCFY